MATLSDDLLVRPSKHIDCIGCELERSPGSVGCDFVSDSVDVIFVGEAPGSQEVKDRRPFVGPAGRILRSTLKALGIESYGITNVWRCRPPNNKLEEAVGSVNSPGVYCREQLVHDLTAHNQYITVSLGSTALSTLVHDKSVSIMDVQGSLLKIDLNGNELLLLPILHPAALIYQKSLWRDWEIGMEKLQNLLKNGVVNYIPLRNRAVYCVQTKDEALRLLKRASRYRQMCFDVEAPSTAMPWEGGYLLSVAIAWSYTESVSIPWRVAEEHIEVYNALKELLEDESKIFVGYNTPFDYQLLYGAGINVKVSKDSMYLLHLYDERNERHRSLKKDSGIFLNAPNWEVDIKKWVPKKEDLFTNIPEPVLLRYNGMDVMHNLQLENTVKRLLCEHEDLRRENGWGSPLAVYERITIPAINMLNHAKRVGTRIDMYRLKELHDRFVPVLRDLVEECSVLTGIPWFNPNSPAQKVKALNNRPGISVQNSKAETLQEFEGDELVDALTAYSQAHKIFSTYIKGIVEDISDDLRVHPDFKLPAENGRLRCADPNMLGMPRKAEESEHRWKRYVKEIFVADKDRVLIHVDQKQSEIRCACFISQDDVLAKIVRSGEDLHGAMAFQMYGEGYTHEQRVLAKMVTFGLIYNRKAKSLAFQLTAVARAEARRKGKATYHKWTIGEAQKVIDKFFRQMPRLLSWRLSIMEQAVLEGYLVSWFGRFRRFGLVTPINKAHIENEAVNYPISSVSTDLNLLNCNKAYEELGKYGLWVHVPIHDALLGSIPRDSLSLVDEVKGIFEQYPNKVLGTDLPFRVDVSVGERWSEL